VVAARLRATGWLLPTAQRGIYEFAPGSHAGPYGHGDPFIDLRTALLAEHHPVVIALQSALWLHGIAERAPDRHELAVPVGATVPGSVKRRMRVVHFSAQLPMADIDQLPVHQPGTILVHLATKPGDVLDGPFLTSPDCWVDAREQPRSNHGYKTDMQKITWGDKTPGRYG